MEDIANDGACEYNVFRQTCGVFRADDSGGGGLICSWCFEVVRRAWSLLDWWWQQGFCLVFVVWFREGFGVTCFVS